MCPFLQEDKAKLLCLITELSLTPDCSTADCRDNLQRALVEVKNLLDKKKSAPDLRVKYYLRILIPLGEVRHRNVDFRVACGVNLVLHLGIFIKIHHILLLNFYHTEAQNLYSNAHVKF